MSHKTMIDGVAYEISGGKTLINGTAYSIKNGKTLVGGTAYDVGFGGGMVTVNITGNGDTDTFVVIAGTSYDYETSGIEVAPGDTIKLACYFDPWDDVSKITIDGEEMTTYVSGMQKVYDWTVPDGITLIDIMLDVYSITVTTS